MTSSILTIVFLAPLLLCWGSFLNVIAYRLMQNVSFRQSRSICPHCNCQIAWYDLFPVISWFNLNGKCRQCLQKISILYPIIELATLVVGLGLFYLVYAKYQFAYFILISALLIIVRTDLETMQISRFTTLFLIPLAFAFSLTYYSNYPLLPLNISDVLKGALFGYFILFFTNKIFFYLTKKQGMGQGDLDLLALIGAFTGVTGAWISLMIGSIVGSLAGITMMHYKGCKLGSQIPFGPFLAFGAISYILFQNQLLQVLFY